jgi:hypothetical protein
MQMVADGALGECDQPGSLAVHDTFTAIVEGRATKTVGRVYLG